MKVNYNLDNVKTVVNTVFDITGKNVKDIQDETLFSRIVFDDNSEMNVKNDFGRISKIDFCFSKDYVHNYSVVLEKRVFQIQGYIRKKILDDYVYSTYSLVPFTKRLYLNDSRINELNQAQDQINNYFRFRMNNRKKYNFEIYPTNENLNSNRLNEEFLLKVDELANYLYILKKKYKFHDYNFEEIIKTLLLQYKLDLDIEDNFKRIFNENNDEVLIKKYKY